MFTQAQLKTNNTVSADSKVELGVYTYSQGDTTTACMRSSHIDGEESKPSFEMHETAPLGQFH